MGKYCNDPNNDIDMNIDIDSDNDNHENVENLKILNAVSKKLIQFSFCDCCT